MLQPILGGSVKSTTMRTSAMWRLNAYTFALLLVVSGRAAEASVHELFTRAIQNDSTAPNYVLITVVNDKTKEAGLVCTEAPFLLAAIHRERQITYDHPGVRKVKDLALAQTNRTFQFSREDALKNITHYYNEAMLIEMRSALKRFSNEEIRKGFRGDGQGLDKLYMQKPSQQYSAYRDAIAHVLLERGLLPRRGCVAGYLTVDE
jgi:hypothetical protein